MHFNQAKFLFTLVALMGLLTSVMGVTLHQYTRPNCHGKRAACTRLGDRVCCKSRRSYTSGSCQGCTSTDFHLVWNFANRKNCGRNVKATNGGRCIGGSSNLRGHSWCRLCRTSVDQLSQAQSENISNEATCTSTVEPSLLEIGSKWFQLNDSMNTEHKEALWDLWQKEVEDHEVDSHLQVYVSGVDGSVDVENAMEMRVV